MIDTIVLQSPYIEYNKAKKIEQFSYKRMGVEVKTGEIIYCITTAELKGTYDSSIRIKVEYEEYKTFEYNGKIITEKKPSQPYVIVECSLHKLIQGHNIYGGSDDLKQFEFLIKFLEKEINIQLPVWYKWILRRLDYAEVFDLGQENVYNYIQSISNGYFSRRKCLRFGNTGFYVPGTTTTLKFYAKGPEFKKNDYKRLIHFDDYGNTAKFLQEIANDILRVEVEIKPKKIKYDNNNKLLELWQYKDCNYFKNIFNNEVKKLIKLVDNDRKQYIKYDEVKKVLNDKYNSSYANNLLGTWLRLSLVGEEQVKQEIKKTTFYRHRKELINSNCVWNNNIIEKSENNIIDFIPYSNSKYIFKRNIVKDAEKKMKKLFNDYKIS